jgi:Domain of unknown function (DUF1992)
MYFLERLADQHIQEAIERGDLDNLPGAGRPLPEEPELTGIAPELRMAYRIMKSAGFLPEEVRIRREIGEIGQLLRALPQNDDREENLRRRYRLLLQRLGESRAGNLAVQCAYFNAVAKKFDP